MHKKCLYCVQKIKQLYIIVNMKQVFKKDKHNELETLMLNLHEKFVAYPTLLIFLAIISILLAYHHYKQKF